uniref:Uncharacterized protein n=1 Tax=Anguilla anguilla TaxID=7936 RepID=A0A0E9WLQ4_ANGAN
MCWITLVRSERNCIMPVPLLKNRSLCVRVK